MIDDERIRRQLGNHVSAKLRHRRILGRREIRIARESMAKSIEDARLAFEASRKTIAEAMSGD